jgi:acyl-CoA thioesterase-1
MRLVPVAVAILVLVAGCAAQAPTAGTSGPQLPTDGYEIVALGASNTEGHGLGKNSGGVSREDAYPAQLERLLNAEGCHVHVLNAGRAGATTGLMLATLPTVLRPNTKVVILQPGTNDEGRGAGEVTTANVEAIKRAVEAHGARLVILEKFGAIAGPNRSSDSQHFTAQGHALVAAYLAPLVRAAGACGT